MNSNSSPNRHPLLNAIEHSSYRSINYKFDFAALYKAQLIEINKNLNSLTYERELLEIQMELKAENFSEISKGQVALEKAYLAHKQEKEILESFFNNHKLLQRSKEELTTLRSSENSQPIEILKLENEIYKLERDIIKTELRTLAKEKFAVNNFYRKLTYDEIKLKGSKDDSAQDQLIDIQSELKTKEKEKAEIEMQIISRKNTYNRILEEKSKKQIYFSEPNSPLTPASPIEGAIAPATPSTPKSSNPAVVIPSKNVVVSPKVIYSSGQIKALTQEYLISLRADLLKFLKISKAESDKVFKSEKSETPNLLQLSDKTIDLDDYLKNKKISVSNLNLIIKYISLVKFSKEINKASPLETIQLADKFKEKAEHKEHLSQRRTANYKFISSLFPSSGKVFLKDLAELIKIAEPVATPTNKP